MLIKINNLTEIMTYMNNKVIENNSTKYLCYRLNKTVFWYTELGSTIL